jgi:undecaprenyl-diphosphatase
MILPGILGWHIDEQDPFFLTFLVATHLATALVLFGFYFGDWMNIIGGIFRSIAQRNISPEDTYAKLGWLLVVGTIPAGVIGLLFEKPIRAFFISPRSAAFFLILNGILLLGAEVLRRRQQHAPTGGDARISSLTWGQGIFVGTAQVLALIPGFSRTGATLAGGLVVNLSHEDALRYSFLLATPIIAAAALLKLPDLILHGTPVMLQTAFIGAIASGATAYLSVIFLSKFFALERARLTPFAIYCVLAGGAALLLVA